MADIADVLDALETMAFSAVFPAGAGTPSLTGKIVNIAQGWPPANALNDAMANGNSLVSIYAVPSTTSKLPVPLSSGSDPTLVAPIPSLTASVAGNALTVLTSPATGENATVTVNRTVYGYTAQAGDTAATVAAALAAQIPGAVASAGVLTVSGAWLLSVRIGATGTAGVIIDRQRQNIMVSVWAPNPADRTVLGRALKLAVGQNLTLALADTTQAILIAQTESLIDKYQDELAFRRDLVVKAQWDTLDQYPAYEITHVDMQTTPPVR